MNCGKISVISVKYCKTGGLEGGDSDFFQDHCLPSLIFCLNLPRESTGCAFRAPAGGQTRRLKPLKQTQKHNIMKKTLLLGAFLAFAGIASAQTLSFTVDGQAVENGGTFTSYTVHTDEGEDYFSIQLAPKVELTASSDVNVTVEFTPTKMVNITGAQMCWPMNCQMTKEGKTIYSTGNLTSGVAANRSEEHTSELPVT